MRQQILDIIIAHQKQLVQNLQKSLETYDTTTDLDEESTIDLDDQSHQADVQDLKLEMNQKLQMEQEDYIFIRSLQLREVKCVEEAAIVETKEAYFFIGFTFAPIDMENKKIFGVSLEAPVYQHNEGKKEGDYLILGNQKQKILNIF